MTKRLGKNDILLLGILALVLTAGCGIFYLLGQKEGASVEVTVDGELYGIYSLEQDQTVDIVIDETTANVLKIQNGSADIIEADCPDKLCVHQQAISKEKETIVCLPNKVVVEVIGGEEAGFDSMT